MLFQGDANVEIGGTDYVIEYTITQEEGEDEADGRIEYGIRCELFEAEVAVSVEEVKSITTDFEKINLILQKLMENQVFPAHLRDVLEDLLITEYEVRESLVFNTIGKRVELSTCDEISAERQHFLCSQCELL